MARDLQSRQGEPPILGVEDECLRIDDTRPQHARALTPRRAHYFISRTTIDSNDARYDDAR